MVKMLIEFEFNVETILDSDFHFHLCLSLGLLNIAIIVHDCKINFFGDSGLHISINNSSDEISDSPSNAIKSFVLFFEIGELELELFIFS